MKLILHPGHSKCGSTTIQQALIKNRAKLKVYGIHIPDPQLRLEGEPGFNPHGETPRQFFRFAMEKRDTSELERKLERIISSIPGDGHALLVSAENLVNQLRTPAGQNIHKALARYFNEIQVVYYIKRQDDFILSAWQQWGYKKGKTIDEYVDESLRVGNPNYATAARFFAKTYGAANISLVPVNEKSLYGGKLLEDFFFRIGVPSEDLDLSLSTKNKSINPAICQVLSKIPHLYEDVHDEGLKIKLTSLLGTKGPFFSRFDEVLTSKVRNEILDYYHDDNKYLHHNFFPQLEFDDIFGKKPVQCDDAIEELRIEVEKLYQIMAFQMQLMIKLIDK